MRLTKKYKTIRKGGLKEERSMVVSDARDPKRSRVGRGDSLIYGVRRENARTYVISRYAAPHSSRDCFCC